MVWLSKKEHTLSCYFLLDATQNSKTPGRGKELPLKVFDKGKAFLLCRPRLLPVTDKSNTPFLSFCGVFFSRIQRLSIEEEYVHDTQRNITVLLAQCGKWDTSWQIT